MFFLMIAFSIVKRISLSSKPRVFFLVARYGQMSFSLAIYSTLFHISPTLAALGWHRVDDMVRTHDRALVARAVNGKCPPAITAMFTRRADVSLRNSRAAAAGTLDLPRCRLVRTQRSFTYRAASAWNAQLTRS